MSTKLPRAITPATEQRVLVLFPGALGDFICFLPALNALAERAFVDLFARSEFADLVPDSVCVRSIESYKINRLFVPDAASEDVLRRFLARYASIYSWLGSGNDVFVQRLQELCGERAQIFPFDSAAAKGQQSEYYLSCLGIVTDDKLLPKVVVNPEAMLWSGGFWARRLLGKSRVLIIAPGSGAREKNWPAEKFASVAEWWRAEGGEPLVVIGPVEEERGGLEALLRRFTVARNLTLGQLAAVIARADIYLGNDSGVTHLAAALGIPTVALFGPSNSKKWRPRGQRVAVLHHVSERAPRAGALVKTCAHRSCLCALEPCEVIQQVSAMAGITRLDKVGVRD